MLTSESGAGLRGKIVAALAIGLFATTSAQAASISYYLNQSDELPDDINYLQVTISDGSNGGIDFVVEVLQPLLDLAGGPKFGITQFAFNAVEGISVRPSNLLVPISPRWNATFNNQTMAGFGKYDVRLNQSNRKNRGKGKGSETGGTTTFEFSIVGIDFDTIASYVDLARLAYEGPSFFSARVSGLDIGCANPSSAKRTNKGGGSSPQGCEITEAYFGGVAAVPAPPAVWLLGTALVALGARRLKKARAAT